MSYLLALTDKTVAQDFVYQIGISHIRNLFKNRKFSSINEMGGCYAAFAFTDENIATELLAVITNEPEKLSESMNESVDYIESPNAFFNEIMSLIDGVYMTMLPHELHHEISDNLFDGLDKLITERLAGCKWSSVGTNGGNMHQLETLDETTKNIKEEHALRFGYLPEGYLERILARFGVTLTIL